MARKDVCANKKCSHLLIEDNPEHLPFERTHIEKSDGLCPHCENRLKAQ